MGKSTIFFNYFYLFLNADFPSFFILQPWLRPPRDVHHAQKKAILR